MKSAKTEGDPGNTIRTSTIIEAKWAPGDPRDRLYDEDATRTEKTVSVARLFASFHPVLNIFILFAESFRHFGKRRAFLFWLLLLVLVIAIGL